MARPLSVPSGYQRQLLGDAARRYTCFVCGEKGSVFTFVQKRLGMSFVEAVKYVGAKSGIEVQDVQRKREGPDPREPFWELHGTVSEYFQRQLWDAPAGEAARAYLREREVSRDTAVRFGMGYAPRDPQALRAHPKGWACHWSGRCRRASCCSATTRRSRARASATA